MNPERWFATDTEVYIAGTVDVIAECASEHRAEQIAREHNGHATLIVELERLARSARAFAELDGACDRAMDVLADARGEARAP